MKNRTIWIWNHYATNMFYEKGGRHHWFGKYLTKKGYNVKIFCASTIHNSDFQVETNGEKFITNVSDEIEYVFLKTPKYTGNGKARIKNMYAFYRGLFAASKQMANVYGKPDVIMASSVHPLTLVAGIKIANKFKVPCVCEVRDLWPESLIEFGLLDRNSPIAKVLYKGEKWIYSKADKLVFTMPGGRDYIIEHGIDKTVDIKNIYNINNGIDLEEFEKQKKEIVYDDSDLNGKEFKILYTGSIRSANHVGDLVKAAEICEKRGADNLKFIIFGDGDEKEKLEKYIKDKKIKNIVFKGRVEKKYIPNILSKGNLNVVTGEDSNLGKYGISWNKLFEYMASGKPILADYRIQRYNFVEDYDFGKAERFESIDAFAEEIIRMGNLNESQYGLYSQNALKAAADFDYSVLTEKLEKVFDEAILDYGES